MGKLLLILVMIHFGMAAAEGKSSPPVQNENAKVAEVAIKIFQKMHAQSKGDPAQMQALLNEARSNPEAFVKKYVNEADYRQLASELEKAKTSPSN